MVVYPTFTYGPLPEGLMVERRCVMKSFKRADISHKLWAWEWAT